MPTTPRKKPGPKAKVPKKREPKRDKTIKTALKVKKTLSPRTRKKVNQSTATLYHPRCHQTIAKIGAEGGSKTAMSLALGITRRCFYDWLDRYPAFAEAVDLATQSSQVEWEGTLRDQAKGNIEGGSATAAIFAMKNQFPTEYRDRREVDVRAQQVVTIDFMGLDGEVIDMEEDIPSEIEGEIYRG